jgi:hypothetical protein
MHCRSRSTYIPTEREEGEGREWNLARFSTLKVNRCAAWFYIPSQLHENDTNKLDAFAGISTVSKPCIKTEAMYEYMFGTEVHGDEGHRCWPSR